ncbi:Uncharacterised protein [Vibrio cholerae]|nr:Uncharacterised protein [Vibrio cholerae]
MCDSKALDDDEPVPLHVGSFQKKSRYASLRGSVCLLTGYLANQPLDPR